MVIAYVDPEGQCLRASHRMIVHTWMQKNRAVQMCQVLTSICIHRTSGFLTQIEPNMFYMVLPAYSRFSGTESNLPSPELLSPERRAVSPTSLSILSLRAASSAAKRASPEPNSSSISSRVLPFVSGTYLKVSAGGVRCKPRAPTEQHSRGSTPRVRRPS